LEIGWKIPFFPPLGKGEEGGFYGFSNDQTVTSFLFLSPIYLSVESKSPSAYILFALARSPMIAWTTTALFGGQPLT